jgi:Predicted transcriptional regulator with C-terminal CBS domains
MQASDVMTSPVYVVAPHENVAHARNLMLKHKISRLPVMDNDCIAGMITKKTSVTAFGRASPSGDAGLLIIFLSVSL